MKATVVVIVFVRPLPTAWRHTPNPQNETPKRIGCRKAERASTGTICKVFGSPVDYSKAPFSENMNGSSGDVRPGRETPSRARRRCEVLRSRQRPPYNNADPSVFPNRRCFRSKTRRGVPGQPEGPGLGGRRVTRRSRGTGEANSSPPRTRSYVSAAAMAPRTGAKK